VVSVDQLLDAHEVAVRARVEGLREQAGLVAVELAEAELALEHAVITRMTLAVVLAEGGRGSMTPQAVDVLAATGADATAGAGRGSVPVWQAGMGWVDLPVKYRPVWQAVTDTGRPLRAGQVAAVLGWDTSRTAVEGLRYRLKRLVATGWLSELVVAEAAVVSPPGPQAARANDAELAAAVTATTRRTTFPNRRILHRSPLTLGTSRCHKTLSPTRPERLSRTLLPGAAPGACGTARAR
jgi:hypothetical protein